MSRFKDTCFFLILIFCCCRKPYNPAVTSSPGSFLVVEGVLNSGSDSTFIKISRTVKLSDSIIANPELGATVKVEDDNTFSAPLIDADGTGIYISPNLALQPNVQYRLHITTQNGSQYVSDFVPIKPTPPIDSVGYLIQNENVNLYVNTHDPLNTTRYYRWEYDETYIFHSKYQSSFILDPSTSTIVPRTGNQMVYYCFANDVSSSIILFSSEKLSQDVVFQNPLTQIPLSSEKVENKYSILVKEYALTPDAYNFYVNIKKNTEQLGSIFDAQPSQLIGNIHNLNNSSEAVIGFITATNVQSKRIFITNSQLPQVPINYPFNCQQDSALFHSKSGGNQVLNTLIDPPFTALPTSAIYSDGFLVGYQYTVPICADCTLRGNQTTPSFWK